MVPRKKVRKGGPEAGRGAREEAAKTEEAAGATAAPSDAGVAPEVEAAPEAKSARTAKQEVESLRAEFDELMDRHLRVVAEFDNFRKRTIRERAQLTERAQAELVKQLLDSLDDLARVSELSSTDHDASVILEGVQLVERKLLRALGQCGLKPIDAEGRPFDPELHEALSTVTTELPEEDEVVSQELAKGYLFNETLLRPAQVEVKKYRAASEGDGPKEADGES